MISRMISHLSNANSVRPKTGTPSSSISSLFPPPIRREEPAAGMIAVTKGSCFFFFPNNMGIPPEKTPPGHARRWMVFCYFKAACTSISASA